MAKVTTANSTLTKKLASIALAKTHITTNQKTRITHFLSPGVLQTKFILSLFT